MQGKILTASQCAKAAQGTRIAPELNQCAEERQQFHVGLDTQIDMTRGIVYRLQELHAKINGGDLKPCGSDEGSIHPPTTLSGVLHSGSARLMDMRNEAMDLIASIEQELF